MAKLSAQPSFSSCTPHPPPWIDIAFSVLEKIKKIENSKNKILQWPCVISSSFKEN
jgi:hypothetical protein